jgi:peroxiredoxin
MLADGNGDYARALGLELDATKFGMGRRSQRFSMVVDDGIVKELNIDSGKLDLSSAECALSQL